MLARNVDGAHVVEPAPDSLHRLASLAYTASLGKHVAITGASSGFGAHFAHLLAGEGAQVSLGACRIVRGRFCWLRKPSLAPLMC
ncbi:MAG: NADPH:quinone reductase-like Zn-dependent oxidoreductase [Cyclobacteriaceae bacterium]|jgi:NADPH:quinone reductase-like Zn-dependent oxidoreductase